jgi:hypothetical protein
MTPTESVLAVLCDEHVTEGDRILHGIAHLFKRLDRIEEMLMTTQQDVDALGQRLSDGLDRVEQKIDAGSAPNLDLSPITAQADRLDTLVPAETAPAPGPLNTDAFQPLYVIAGDANPDPSQWTQQPGVTTPDGHPLFTYAGDATTPGSPATGDGVAGFSHYAGELVAVS